MHQISDMRFKLLLVFLFVANIVAAQRLSGKISNTSNEPVTGASVRIVGTERGVITNTEGRFDLLIPEKAELEISAVGYQTKVITDFVKQDGRFEDILIILETRSSQLEEVIVTSKKSSAKIETATAAIQFQKNTNTVASVISSETIRRSPDRNSGEVLKRTPGASLQDGRFLIVRGLADRYNQALLNGILLTSTEPDRKTFSFDLIPSQAVDNIIINKAFVPEFPGEWAGGLVQVNTKDIPTKNFLNVQLGTGFNTASTFKPFFRDAQGGKLDWLGVDDGTRALPDNYTTKSNFDTTSREGKIAVGKRLRNSWMPRELTAPLNYSFQLNGGFKSDIGNKKLGGLFGLTYSRNFKYQELLNRRNIPNETTNKFDTAHNYFDDKYSDEIVVGAFASAALQINNNNKISGKALINVNSNNTTVNRDGWDRSRIDESLIQGTEFTFRQTTFFTTQLMGEHTIISPLKFKWYGAFSILDAYVPDQRRLTYSRKDETTPWEAIISNTLSQQSGSHVYQSLSDYIYTAGGDFTYNIKRFRLPQYVKAGYMLQVKDRLYDAQLFATYLPNDNRALRLLPQDKIFDSSNYGDGSNNKFAFDAIKNRNFRYLANTILNAGFIQFDNQLAKSFRVVWGLRIENYDQLVGSVKKWDPRHVRSNVTDLLPGLNATYKLGNNTNIRASVSQTVIRPELRELSAMELYDFELNASVRGLPTLQRGKILNSDLRYEIYPRAGETFSMGMFYKKFKTPIEQSYTDGAGGSSSFFFTNPQGAYAYGLEVELRKKLDFFDATKHFTFQSNVSVIKSRIQDDEQKIDRPLQGQSPYLVNAALMYDLEKYGLNATALFNIVGERIYLVGDYQAGAPDVYEAPRPVLDFQIAKKVLQNKGEFKLNVSDILNQKQYFYQNIHPEQETSFQKSVDAYRFTRNFGTSFTLTFNYTL